MNTTDIIVRKGKDIVYNKLKSLEQKQSEDYPIGYMSYNLDRSSLNLIIYLLELGAAVANTNTFDLNMLSDEDRTLIYHKMFEYKTKQLVLEENVEKLKKSIEEKLRRDLHD